jgi:hypothetical protein
MGQEIGEGIRNVYLCSMMCGAGDRAKTQALHTAIPILQSTILDFFIVYGLNCVPSPKLS